MSTEQSQAGGLKPCCMSGKLQNGTPTGKMEEMFGRETYVAVPKSGDKSKAVIFLTDIFGPHLPNSQLLCDEIAKAGFYVVMPMLIEGPLDIQYLNHIEPRAADVPNLTATDKIRNTATYTTQMVPFSIRNREAVQKPKVDDFIAALRQDGSIKSLGAVGYCWGGRHAILQAHSGSQVDAAASFHPALQDSNDFDNVAKPLSIGFAEKDTVVPETIIGEAIEKLGKKTDVKTEIRIYEDQVHGFALRGDYSYEKDKKAMDDAQEQMLEWFKNNL